MSDQKMLFTGVTRNRVVGGAFALLLAGALAACGGTGTETSGDSPSATETTTSAEDAERLEQLHEAAASEVYFALDQAVAAGEATYTESEGTADEALRQDLRDALDAGIELQGTDYEYAELQPVRDATAAITEAQAALQS